jgi:diguanylate cyclase (GGDEF)-like protein/PAS domain S-box-containing protein
MSKRRNYVSLAFSNSFLKNFLKVFLSIALVVLIIALVYFFVQTGSTHTLMKVEQASTVELQYEIISGEFGLIVGDLLFLAEHNELQAYLETSETELKEAVADEYLLLLTRKGVYDQVSYLDNTGTEIIRVDYKNGEPAIVPQGELQSKGDRTSFYHTFALDRSKIFISPFDFSGEQDQIEHARKPVIQFGTPVFDYLDQKRGVVFVSYLVEGLLDQVKQASERSAGGVILLDEAGYWLNCPGPWAEWGSRFNAGQNLSMKHIYPEAWQQISSAGEGQFETQDGLYTFTTIYPHRESQNFGNGTNQAGNPSSTQISSGDYSWKIVSFVPRMVLTLSIQRTLLTIGLIITPLLLAGAVVSVILAKGWVVEEQASDARQLTAKVFESTNEGIFITDRDGNIVNANQAFTTITGYPVNEAVGKNPRIFKSDRQDKNFYEAFWKELIEKGRWQGEMWNLRKNGEVYPCWLRISAMEDEQGQLVHYVAVFADITERKQTEERLEFLATHDPLTNLPNRSLFNDQFKHALDLANRSGSKVALMYLDLDGFKQVNDTYGHEAGDQLLRDISARFRSELRESDTVARLGGDEFAFIIENIKDQENIANVAEKILEAIYQTLLVADLDVDITGSLGVSIYPDNGEAADLLLKKADRAMYLAKEAGKNMYYLYQE